MRLLNAKPLRVMLVIVTAALPIAFRLNRDCCSSMAERWSFTLLSTSFFWGLVCLLQTLRRSAKLGWQRSHFTRLLSGPCPSDPDEALVWRWAQQYIYAVLAFVVCVISLVLIQR